MAYFRICSAALLLSIFSCVDYAEPARVKGRVVGVRDGDSIDVLIDGRSREIRLYGIDCPERDQPYWKQARQFTSNLAFGRMVSLIVKDRDDYGRRIAVAILHDGRNLNQELVRAGYAWWYRHYAPDDKALAELESEAREAKRGLWVARRPVPPWNWRRQDR